VGIRKMYIKIKKFNSLILGDSNDYSIS